MGELPAKQERIVSMTMTHQPVVRKTDEGRTIGVVSDVYRFLATGDDTDGKYALWEAIVPPGGGPPPHIHSREEEGFYVLEGEITIQLGEDRFVAQAGTVGMKDFTGKKKVLLTFFPAAFTAG